MSENFGIPPAGEQQEKSSLNWKAALFTLVGIGVVALIFFMETGSGSAQRLDPSTLYDGEPIPTLTQPDRENLQGNLAKLEQQYGGVCFGWQLIDASSGNTQEGSSKGADIPASNCPRWARAVVKVGYTSESSEAQDGADVYVEASPDLKSASLIGGSEFDRLGIDPGAMVDDPVATTGHAALAVPLLLVEAGDLPAIEAAPAGTTPQLANLPSDSGDSDFPIFRVLLVILLGLGSVSLIAVGVVQWRSDRAQGGQR